MTEKKNNRFLLVELIRRDFIKKYKRTTLGILWSALAPLFLLITMDIVFGAFFGLNLPHYTIYLFSGLLLFNYFSNITRNSMSVLYINAPIYSKVPVPKLYFLFSHSVANFIDFLVSLAVFRLCCHRRHHLLGKLLPAHLPHHMPVFHKLRHMHASELTVYFLP